MCVISLSCSLKRCSMHSRLEFPYVSPKIHKQCLALIQLLDCCSLLNQLAVACEIKSRRCEKRILIRILWFVISKALRYTCCCRRPQLNRNRKNDDSIKFRSTKANSTIKIFESLNIVARSDTRISVERDECCVNNAAFY